MSHLSPRPPLLPHTPPSVGFAPRSLGTAVSGSCLCRAAFHFFTRLPPFLGAFTLASPSAEQPGARFMNIKCLGPLRLGCYRAVGFGSCPYLVWNFRGRVQGASRLGSGPFTR